MSDLGDLLELLHGARRAYRSARASIRVWRDEGLDREARLRAAERRERERSVWIATVAAGGGSGDARASGNWEKLSRLWVSLPSSARCESQLEWKGEQTRAITVLDGRYWWSDTPSQGFRASTDDPRVNPIVPELDLLDPWELAGDLEFEVSGSAACAGREAIEARAVAQDLRMGHYTRVVPGADEYALAVDVERGVMLRCTALLDGAPIESSEVTEIVFDEDIDPGLFRLQPRPESERRPPSRLPRSACSFCGKPGEEVEQLIVGHPVYICNECVGVSAEIATPHDRPGDS